MTILITIMLFLLEGSATMSQAEWINAIIDDFKVNLLQKNAGPNEYFVRTILNPDKPDYITKIREREGQNGETGFIGEAEALLKRRQYKDPESGQFKLVAQIANVFVYCALKLRFREICDTYNKDYVDEKIEELIGSPVRTLTQRKYDIKCVFISVNFGPKVVQDALNAGKYTKWLNEMIDTLPKKKQSAVVNDNEEEKSGENVTEPNSHTGQDIQSSGFASSLYPSLGAVTRSVQSSRKMQRVGSNKAIKLGELDKRYKK